MGDSLNISVLCAAKEEYLNQLKHYLAPIMQEGFESIYEDAQLTEPTAVLRQFQIFLKQIPRWNQTLLETETKRIREKCPFLMDLVTAIFVSHVKILASVRLGGDHKNIKLKIPTSEIFIHGIYVNSAEKFFYEPHPFTDLRSHKNKETIKDIIEETIEATISSLIPIQDILQEYLSSAFNAYTKPPPPPPSPPPSPSLRVFDGNELFEPANEFSIGDQPPFLPKLSDEVRTIPPLTNPSPPSEDWSDPPSVPPPMAPQATDFAVPSVPPMATDFADPSVPPMAPQAMAPQAMAPQAAEFAAPPPMAPQAAESEGFGWLESAKDSGGFFGDSGSLPD